MHMPVAMQIPTRMLLLTAYGSGSEAVDEATDFRLQLLRGPQRVLLTVEY